MFSADIYGGKQIWKDRWVRENFKLAQKTVRRTVNLDQCNRYNWHLPLRRRHYRSRQLSSYPPANIARLATRHAQIYGATFRFSGWIPENQSCLRHHNLGTTYATDFVYSSFERYRQGLSNRSKMNIFRLVLVYDLICWKKCVFAKKTLITN